MLERIEKSIPIKDMAIHCKCSMRTIRDWKREKFLIDEQSIKFLCRKAKITFPQKSIVEVRDSYWYTKNGSMCGGYAVLEKYGRIGGDPMYRVGRWREWWEREGKHKNGSITEAKPIFTPLKSNELAEFVGIILGDGSITHNQVVVTLHRNDDREYGWYVTKLIVSLFHVPVGIYKSKRFLADDLVVSRVNLVKFCVEQLDLKVGNKVKQQVSVPRWIIDDKEFSVACVRGLVDTDGSIFSHTYAVKGKKYTYKKLSFSNTSLPIIEFVYSILVTLKITARKTRNNKEVRIDAVDSMARYFKLIGTHNPKHLKHYKK